MKVIVIGHGGLVILTRAIVAAPNAIHVTAGAMSELADVCAKHDEDYMKRQYKYTPTYRDIEFTGKHRKAKR